MLRSKTRIQRPHLLGQIEECLDEAPITALLGARQTGKTTLARLIAARRRPVHYFDLDRAPDRTALSTPEQTLGTLAGLVVLDEVQRLPELFSVLRPLVDRPENPARFLLLGSASPGLVKGVSETLAGRVLFVSVAGFVLAEIGVENRDVLWLRGGFPRSYLAASDRASARWREALVETFLERDIPQLGFTIPAETLRRFWTMLSHYHGQTWNGSELARALGTNEKTMRRYLDILAGTYLVRVLPPWFENIGKRQRKAPKVYIRDPGLLHTLLGIGTMAQLRSHPKYGASWEGFALEQVLMSCGQYPAYFWGTQRGAELDLFITHAGKRYGFEFKCTDAPRTTKSMRIASEDLGLEHLWVIYPGDLEYPLAPDITALPLKRIGDLALAATSR